MFTGVFLLATIINFAWTREFMWIAFVAGVVLTSNGAVLTFTAVVAGTNFTGATSGANASGDLVGTPATPTANVLAAVNDNKWIVVDYPLTKFTPAKGSFWVFYNYE